jgi:hypothetical protein
MLEVRDSWEGKSEVGGVGYEGRWLVLVLEGILTVVVKVVRVTG